LLSKYGAYYKLWSRVNHSLSLAFGFKPGILYLLRVVHVYWNMLKVCH